MCLGNRKGSIAHTAASAVYVETTARVAGDHRLVAGTPCVWGGDRKQSISRHTVHAGRVSPRAARHEVHAATRCEGLAATLTRRVAVGVAAVRARNVSRGVRDVTVHGDT